MIMKLAIRNAKRQASSYLFYFITIICAVAFMFGFNSLIYSDIIKNLSELEILPYMIITTSIFVIFILAWLVNYMTNFMLKKRSKELSTYMILGIQNKNISKMFLIESFLLGIFAFGIGILGGTLISKLLEAIIYSLFGIEHHVYFSFSFHALSLSLLYFILIYFFALCKNIKLLKKMKLYDLLYYEKINESFNIRSNFLDTVMFLASIIIGICGICLLLFMPIGKGVDILVGLVFVTMFLFGFFRTVPFFIENVAQKNFSWKYKRNRLVLLRTFTSKIVSISTTFGMLSILFTLALTSISITIGMNKVVNKSIELNIFDIVILHKGDMSEMKDYMSTIENVADIKAAATYNIFTSNSTILKNIREQAIRDNGNAFNDIYVEFRYDSYMKYSDYVLICEMLGADIMDLGKDEFLIQCIPALEEAIQNSMESNFIKKEIVV